MEVSLMHLVVVLLSGVLLLLVFAMFGWHWGASAGGVLQAAKLFVPFWFLVALANMWVGVVHAGYGVREELPILLLVFAFPSVLAGGLIWWVSRS
ncbi:hypothetical protein [Hydrogenophaga sp. RWCD_12]|uniref:hypothetical protein n=1 Tax=Hydrogenophaga sp. RWCD_12 TaxID=3391190 RepID=UPI0039852F67